MRPRLLVTVALLFGPAACGASASISSVRDPSIKAHFNRLYLALESEGVDPQLATKLGDALGKELQQRRVVVKMHVLNGLDADEKVADGDIKAWRPDGILVSALSAAGGGIGDVSLDVSLIAMPANQRVWRAQVHTRKSFGTDSGVAEESAESIGEQLEQDGLIGARP